MKNTIELEVRALRPPRVLKQTEAGEPELIDVWAIHHGNRSTRQWAIAIKFGREIVHQACEIRTGTLFTVKGRLDQNRNATTGIYHTFVWAEALSDVIHSTKNHPESPTPEPPLSQDDQNPELELPHA